MDRINKNDTWFIVDDLTGSVYTNDEGGHLLQQPLTVDNKFEADLDAFCEVEKEHVVAEYGYGSDEVIRMEYIQDQLRILIECIFCGK